MDNIEFLKASREANKEWLADFRERYGIIPGQREDDHLTPQEWQETHSHHGEFEASRH